MVKTEVTREDLNGVKFRKEFQNPLTTVVVGSVDGNEGLINLDTFDFFTEWSKTSDGSYVKLDKDDTKDLKLFCLESMESMVDDAGNNSDPKVLDLMINGFNNGMPLSSTKSFMKSNPNVIKLMERLKLTSSDELWMFVNSFFIKNNRGRIGSESSASMSSEGAFISDPKIKWKIDYSGPSMIIASEDIELNSDRIPYYCSMDVLKFFTLFKRINDKNFVRVGNSELIDRYRDIWYLSDMFCEKVAEYKSKKDDHGEFKSEEFSNLDETLNRFINDITSIYNLSKTDIALIINARMLFSRYYESKLMIRIADLVAKKQSSN